MYRMLFNCWRKAEIEREQRRKSPEEEASEGWQAGSQGRANKCLVCILECFIAVETDRAGQDGMP